MNIKTISLFFVAPFLISMLLTSCASTPKTRVQEKEAEFVKYPNDVQGMIQNGQIDKGFTEDMVYMSKGKPGETLSQTKAGKTVTTWKYFGKPQMTEIQGNGPTGFEGAYAYPTVGAPARPTSAMSYSKPNFSVEFENGKVVRWKEY